MALMSECRKDYLAGLASDLLFSFGTYCVLGTVLGLCAILFHPAVEQVIGYRAASLWWVPISLGYCAWQFWRFRSLRRQSRNQPFSENVGLG